MQELQKRKRTQFEGDGGEDTPVVHNEIKEKRNNADGSKDENQMTKKSTINKGKRRMHSL